MAEFTVTLNEEYAKLVQSWAAAAQITPAQYVQLLVDYCIRGTIELELKGETGEVCKERLQRLVPNTLSYLENRLMVERGEDSPHG